VTGTGAVTVPIPTSPGRSGFGPQLSLSYDSGAGNGTFGFGWSLSTPSITRRTDKGIPRYRDAEESDVFLVPGAEDLVPASAEGAGAPTSASLGGVTYEVKSYRHRIEGSFSRIERWTNPANRGDSFWRSISKDNVTTWYGKTAASRIADPADVTRIFTWLICEVHDDKGNAISYEYKPEDSQGIDPSRAHERNRDDAIRETNRHLKRVRYGNRFPYLPHGEDPRFRAFPSEWFFEVVLDYGEHGGVEPTPREAAAWVGRRDPFSSYRSGFEVRTYRLCRRILMFHHFPEEDVGADCLVRSTALTYSHEGEGADPVDSGFSFLVTVTASAHARRRGGGYFERSLPPLQFEYSEAAIDEAVHEVDPESLENLPVGLDAAQYRWVDLDGEGLSGILAPRGGS
jgi:hypothetical protein